MLKLSRLSKIAGLSAAGGAFYLLRDEMKQYFSATFKNSPTDQTSSEEETKLVKNLPQHVPYLLVGAGTASHSAMRAIRSNDPKAKVLMVGEENNLPYMRPALSKELWYSEKDLRRDLKFKWWNGKERSIFFELDEFFIPIEKLIDRENGGVSLIKNVRLTRLDPDEKTAFLETGQKIKYDKCLLAPGGRPKSLKALDEAAPSVREHITYFRTADDFLKLERLSETANSIAVIGGGFLGSELTCALAKRIPDEKVPKDQVIYQIFPETGNLGKVLPGYLSEWLSKKIESEGAKLKANVEVESVKMTKNGEQVEIKLSNEETILVDHIVCAVGLEPDVDLARSSGLEVDERTGGYLVNSELEARTHVWVAGDASCFYDMKLGRRRVEHHDHAVKSGRLAGENMLGAGKAYTHQPMFWSDLGSDVSFEAVGIIDSSLPTVAVFRKDEPSPKMSVGEDGDLDPNETEQKSISQTEMRKVSVPKDDNSNAESDLYGQGIIFYLKNDIIVGILLWNLFSRLDIARRILDEQKKYDDFGELAKLFNVYLDD